MKLRIALLPLLGLGVAAVAASFPAKRTCTVDSYPQGSGTLQFPPNTQVSPAFFIENTSTPMASPNQHLPQATVTGESGSVTGAGTYSHAVGATSAVLDAGGGTVDANVVFTTGASGNGTVYYNATTSCGSTGTSINFVIVP